MSWNARTRSIGKKLLLSSVAALAVVLLIRAEHSFGLGIIDRLELAALDYRFQLRGARLTPVDTTHVVIVEITKDSFESLPDKWPWPRSYYARLLRNLTKAGARAVGIDVLFVGRDAYSPANDEELRQTLRQAGTAVLAGRLDIDNKAYKIFRASEDYGNTFFSVDSALGFVNVLKDPDEVVRRYLPAADYLPSFGFAVLNRYFGRPPLMMPDRTGEDVFEIAGIAIPAYDETSVLINYFGPSRSFRHVDFADVIDDSGFTTTEEQRAGAEINAFSDPDFGYLYDGTFRDKIVLVGSTVPEDQDIHQVPISWGGYVGANTMFGVEIHANMLESILRQDFLSRQSPAAMLLTVFFLTFVTFFVTSLLKSSKTSHHMMVEVNGFLFAILMIVLVGFASVRLFIDLSYVLPLTGPILAVVAGYFASTAYHFVAERRERVLIKGMFSTYVNPSIVDELVTNPGKLTLGGERRELSVLFSDLEGFTALSESRPPEELVGLLNEYLSSMTHVVLKNDGTVDKFEGDLIMAFWGAPLRQPDHARKACEAALQMQATLAATRLEWGMRKKPLLSARIGLNTGEMIVGNMGSSQKFNYTVIGDSVNLASRLEGANKLYRTSIIISEHTYRQVRNDFICRELDIIAVKGRSEPVRIYELRDRRGGTTEAKDVAFVEAFEEGLTAYRERRWDAATDHFDRALALHPGDFSSDLYGGRIRRFRETPPDRNWKGVSSAAF